MLEIDQLGAARVHGGAAENRSEINEECWKKCAGREGLCKACGHNMACCKISMSDFIPACAGSGCHKFHCCVQARIDCAWAEWSSWRSCSKSCGGGKKGRSRRVKTQAHGGGKPCKGKDYEATECNSQRCPYNCRFEEWQDWKSCSRSCGGGSQKRERVKDQPRDGGKPCKGPSEEVRECKSFACPTLPPPPPTLPPPPPPPPSTTARRRPKSSARRLADLGTCRCIVVVVLGLIFVSHPSMVP